VFPRARDVPTLRHPVLPLQIIDPVQLIQLPPRSPDKLGTWAAPHKTPHFASVIGNPPVSSAKSLS
jgi:hypothetical protein